jgi:hypothetical protein
MKITSSLESFSSARQTATHGASTTSFARLLEGGTQARTVLSHRALSFSEAGVLGLHFAHEQGPSAKPTALAYEDSAKPGNSPAAEAAELAPRRTSTPAAEIQSDVLGRQTMAGPSPRAALPPLIPGREASTAAPSEGFAAPAPLDQASPEEAPPNPLRPPTPPPTRRRLPFQIRLLGDGAELAVVLEGDRCGDESILELEATARAIASEYCMRISHLFVKPNGTGTAA